MNSANADLGPAFATRPRIFALLGERKTLGTTGGDMLNEARFLRSLSIFADVYYNGILFQPDLPNYGLHEKTIEVPKDGYDLYYVRSNHAFFLQLPHPKITMAYPYDAEVFRTADAVVVTTEAWRRGLSPYGLENPFGDCMRHWYGDSIVEPKKVINIRQTLNADFIPDPPEKAVSEAYIRMGMTKVMSFFGRIEENTFPNIAVNTFLQLPPSFQDVRIAMAGTVRTPLHPKIVRLPRIPHTEISAFLSSCHLTLTDEGNDAKFLGSGKVLESMARGIPVLAYKTETRVEQLGEYYPLYYTDPESCATAMRMALRDSDVWQEARRQLLARRRYFLPQTRAQELELELSQLIALCQPSKLRDLHREVPLL